MANEFKIKKGLIVTGASGGTVVDIQGSQGQLFSVTDNLSGSIFAVSDISGVPIFDVNSSGLSTFAGDITLGANHIGRDDDNYIGFESDDLIKFRVAGATQVKISDGVFTAQTDSDVDLGSSGVRFKELWVDSINGGSVVPGSYLPLAGGTMTGTAGVLMPDNFKLKFGDATTPDLQIYHDVNNSYIKDAGTGILAIQGNIIALENTSGVNYFVGVDGAQAELYYNGSSKLQTTSGGIAVTGGGTFTTSVIASGNSNSFGATTFTGVLSLTDGSAGAPAISNTGDANTGMYWPGDHQVGFTVNNSRKFYIAETKAYFQNLSSGVEINAGGIDVTGDSTFAGQVNITSSGAAHFGITNTNVSGSSQQYLQYVGSNGDYVFRNATDSTTPLFLAKNNNATFAGDINLAAGKKLQYSANSFMTPENNVSGAEISTAGTFIVKTGTTPTLALTLNASQNATFSAKAYGVAPITSDPDSTIATKGYVQSVITGATIYRGTWDPDVSLNSGYGNPNLNTVTQTSGYYYICSADGAATPNGTGNEPDSWNTGDWVIWNDDVGASGEWQKIDNSSVLSGVGTGQTVALWQGASSVTDSETLGNAPITVSGNNSTFAGDVVIDDGVGRLTLDSTSGTNRILSTTTGFGTYELLELRAEAYEFKIGTTEKLTIDGSGNATFAGNITIDNSSPDLYFVPDASYYSFRVSAQEAVANTFEITPSTAAGGSTYSTPAFSILATNNAATFAGDITFGDSHFIGDDASDNLLIQSSAGENIIINSLDETLFRINGSTKMQIKSSGNVGIGETSPGSILSIRKDDSTVYDPTSDDGQRAVGPTILLNNNNTTTNTFGQIMYDTDFSGQGVARIVFLDAGTASSAIAFVTEQSDSIGERMRIDSAGNVGIGTTSPASKLHIDSNSNSTYPSGFRDGELRIANDNLSNVANQTSSIVLSATGWAGNSTGVAQLSVIQDGSNISNGTFTIKVRDNGTHSEAFRIKYNGNVGIGATSPGAKLEVGANVAKGVLINRTFTTSSQTLANVRAYYGLAITPLRTGTGGLYFTNYDADTPIIQSVNTSDVAQFLLLNPFGGNVGIGTTSPAYKLVVYETGTASSNIAIDARATGAGTNNYAVWAQGSGASSTNFAFYGAAGKNAFLGNTGIGTDNPGATLDVDGSIRLSTSGTVEGRSYPYTTNIGSGANATTTYIKAGSSAKTEIELSGGDTNSNIIFKTPTNPGNVTTVALTLNDEQNAIFAANVGIGTSTPLAKLDIQGTQGQLFSVTDNLSGSIFAVSDISGVPIFDVNSSGVSYFDGNVGIGTTSPGAKLDVAGSINTSGSINLTNAGVNTIAASNSSNGYLRFLVDQQGVALTLNADTTSTFGGIIYAVDGNKATPGYSFASDPDTGMFRDSANVLVLGVNADTRIRISNSNIVTYKPLGVNTTSITSGVALDVGGVGLIGGSGVGDLYLGNYATANHFRFHTNNSNTYFDMNCGDIYWRQGASTRYQFFASTANMTIQGTLTQNSDARTKENVVEISDCISKVKAMRGVYYNRTDFNTDVTKVGVIAQEVEAVLPELVLESPETGLKSVAYSELTSVLINAIKEQQEIIEDLKTRITKLEN